MLEIAKNEQTMDGTKFSETPCIIVFVFWWL